MAYLRGRLKRMEQAVRGRQYVFRMPDGTTRMHSQDECLDTFMSMVQRARALSKGEEPEPPTPLEWSYIFGTPEGPACPDFSAIALPESAYGEDPGMSFLERDYEEE